MASCKILQIFHKEESPAALISRIPKVGIIYYFIAARDVVFRDFKIFFFCKILLIRDIYVMLFDPLLNLIYYDNS